jgi:hypothetical protein
MLKDKLLTLLTDKIKVNKFETKGFIEEDYDKLIDLRNRLSNATEYPHHHEIFEEDYLLLDSVLDYLECIKEIIK